MQNPNRPTVHIFVIGFLSLTIVASVIVLVGLNVGRSAASISRYWLQITFLIASAFALFCLVVGGRHRWAYYVTSGLLCIWAIRVVYLMVAYTWLFASGTGPISASYSFLAKHHGPFSVQQLYYFGRNLGTIAMVGSIACLFAQFTFSRESRSYFQLKKKTANDVSASLPVEKVH